jgi:hypothetical protein
MARILVQRAALNTVLYKRRGNPALLQLGDTAPIVGVSRRERERLTPRR